MRHSEAVCIYIYICYKFKYVYILVVTIQCTSGCIKVEIGCDLSWTLP